MSAGGTAPARAVVIGGGFYGACIAVHLARRRGLREIRLIEREPALLRRASHNNQARVHNGYHYPRSLITAYRSRINLPLFARDWPQAVRSDFTKLYAIARRNSRVTARQFERFCRDIGAPLEPAPPALHRLFEPRLIEEVFVAREYAFDAPRLALWAGEALRECGVEVHTASCVTSISKRDGGALSVTMTSPAGCGQSLACDLVFNCTYSGLNQFGGDFPGTRMGLKHEITEMALMRAPPALAGLGVTVMDGPFFSLMPFPSRDLHTLSHVRYTPHLHWEDERGIDPYRKLEQYDRATRVERMVRDVARYMPAVQDAEYVDSLFEVKTILARNEGDDGRPILFEQHTALPGCYSVLGGKIDNIFDVIERLDACVF